MQSFPPEVIQLIAAYLPITAVKELRLTCAHVEYAVRHQALANLTLSIGPLEYHANISKLQSLAMAAGSNHSSRQDGLPQALVVPDAKACFFRPSGYPAYRNTLHAKTLRIRGLGDWTTALSNAFKSECIHYASARSRQISTQRVRKWKFWKRALANRGLKWPAYGPLDHTQCTANINEPCCEERRPLYLLQAVLPLLKNVSIVKLQIDNPSGELSPFARDILSQWISSADCTVHMLDITTTTNCRRPIDALDLLAIAHPRVLDICWSHHGYFSDPPVSNRHPFANTPLRIRELSISELYHFSAPQLTPHLTSLTKLHISTECCLNEGTQAQRLDDIWGALKSSAIWLEDIDVPFTPGISDYLQAYHNVLKKVTLNPHPQLHENPYITRRMEPGQVGRWQVTDYGVLRTHVASLVHVDVRAGISGWKLDLASRSWSFHDRPVQPLFDMGLQHLRSLCIPLHTNQVRVRQDVLEVLKLVTNTFSDLSCLVISVGWDHLEASASEYRDAMLELVDMAIAPYKANVHGPLASTQVPPQLIYIQSALGRHAVPSLARCWVRRLERTGLEPEGIAYCYARDPLGSIDF